MCGKKLFNVTNRAVGSGAERKINIGTPDLFLRRIRNSVEYLEPKEKTRHHFISPYNERKVARITCDRVYEAGEKKWGYKCFSVGPMSNNRFQGYLGTRFWTKF